MGNIEYIITAEFHVDKGPSIVHQWPNEIPGYDQLAFLPELMLPDQIHKRDEDYTLFLLHRNATTAKFQYKYEHNICEKEPYFMYTVVQNTKDDLVRRGSVIKALCIITQLSFFKNFRPLMLLCLDKYFPNNDLSLLDELYTAVNQKDFRISANEPSTIKKLLLTSVLDLPLSDKLYSDEAFRNKLLGIRSANPDLYIRKDLSFNLVINFCGMHVPVKLPLLRLPDTIGDYMNPTDLNLKPNLTHLLAATLASPHSNNDMTVYGILTPPIIVLINAILTGKKILFLSYDNSAGYIIDFVLLVLKIVSGGGILTGFLTHFNVFPMIDVSKIDLLESCNSFLAGTINPFFKNHDRLWDLLYDLDANEFHVSSAIAEPQFARSSIISEDAKFLSNLQLSLSTYNDDLTTIQLIFRRHINEIVRILLSLRNAAITAAADSILLMDGVGYYWHSDTSKLIEMSCYQLVSTKFQSLMHSSAFSYTLALPNITNELNLMVDLQHHLQKILNVTNAPDSKAKVNEREIWFNILKYLISGRSLETFLLVTYLIPPTSSTSLQSSAAHGRSVTIFDKNKGIELLLMNLFNEDDKVKSNVVMILQELQDNFFCGWCLTHFIHSNSIYELAYDDLVARATWWPLVYCTGVLISPRYHHSCSGTHSKNSTGLREHVTSNLHRLRCI